MLVAVFVHVLTARLGDAIVHLFAVCPGDIMGIRSLRVSSRYVGHVNAAVVHVGVVSNGLHLSSTGNVHTHALCLHALLGS